VVFFACNGYTTLDAVTDADVCRYGGFHRVGGEPGSPDLIIRTSDNDVDNEVSGDLYAEGARMVD
jgi:hypothetical protein